MPSVGRHRAAEMENRMKKISALALALSLVFALAACAPGNVAVGLKRIERLEDPAPLDMARSITEEEAKNSGVYVEEKRVSLAAVGDNLIHPQIYIDARNRSVAGGRAYNFKPTYEKVADMIASADIAFINQETLMAGESFGYSGYPTFNSPQDLGYDLIELGFDVISMANNHMLDKRNAGYAATIDFWNSTEATMIGGYKNEEDFNTIRVIEKNDLKIAFLAYTEHTNGISLTKGDDLVVPYFDEETIRRQTSRARELADAVVVSMHWGDEDTQTVNANQKKWAALLAECEVDVILGGHSHTLQPIVELDRPSGAKTLCVYSLGNFVSGMANAVNMAGGILTFDIVRTEQNVMEVQNVLLTPTVCHFGPSYYGSYIYYLKDYTDALASIHGIQVYGNRASVAGLTKFVTNAIDAKYLPEEFK